MLLTNVSRQQAVKHGEEFVCLYFKFVMNKEKQWVEINYGQCNLLFSWGKESKRNNKTSP